MGKDEISIKLLTVEDGDILFKFEVKNRIYFNTIGLSRNADYYNQGLFQGILEKLVANQKKDIHYMYLVLNEQGKVVGRVNLTDVIREPLCKAELGYRIDQEYQGNGYATKAIKLVITQANFEHHLHRLEAGTSTNNIGSQVVLMKNGFRLVGKYSQYIFQGDVWTDSLIYENVIDN